MTIHIAVIVVLLINQIGGLRALETSFVLDFTKLEEVEKLEREIAFKEDISRRIDELIGAAPTVSARDYRNIAVDRGSLKDDRGTDAEQLYKDAARLQADLENGSKAALYEDARNETVDTRPTDKGDDRQKEYGGPSVVSYNLDGRKASHLKIPAYKCMGEGRVTVIIIVDPGGNVVQAKVQSETSSTDNCLQNFAVRAARLSKFSASQTAPARQVGDITYEFIAQ